MIEGPWQRLCRDFQDAIERFRREARAELAAYKAPAAGSGAAEVTDERPEAAVLYFETSSEGPGFFWYDPNRPGVTGEGPCGPFPNWGAAAGNAREQGYRVPPREAPE